MHHFMAVSCICNAADIVSHANNHTQLELNNPIQLARASNVSKFINLRKFSHM